MAEIPAILQKILKEPLLHFLIISIGFFVFYSSNNKTSDKSIIAKSEIVISQSQVRNIKNQFERVWKRQPTEQETKGMLKGYIKEEILYREALSLGLDRDDTIIRKRMAQKIDFLFSDIASIAEPTEEQLEKHYHDSQSKYTRDVQLTFSHIYLNPTKHDNTLKTDAEKIIATLKNKKADPADLGDPIMLEPIFNKIETSQINNLFAENFATDISTLETGKWQGPIKSGYGYHLVKIDQRIESQPTPFEEIRTIVKRDWKAIKQKESNDATYALMKQRYKITIEPSAKTQKESK